jgi:fused signal recognition particle receptor
VSLFTTLLGKIKHGLQRTKAMVLEPMGKLLKLQHLDETQLEELEDVLLAADIGVSIVDTLINRLRLELKQSSSIDPKAILRDELIKIVNKVPTSTFNTNNTQVILIVGVNGVGKTTTLGKLAAYLKARGDEVLVVAGDTFRAAAIDQLALWCNLAKVSLIRNQMGGDPAAIAYDGATSALAKNIPWLIVDTAGRLHNKDHLMRELNKISRSLQKVIPSAPQRIILVLDATTGQNGLLQAKSFKQSVGVTDLIITKLDGTAKGGVVISILEQLKLPIAFVGVGEKLDDLVPFSAEDFIDGLLDV